MDIKSGPVEPPRLPGSDEPPPRAKMIDYAVNVLLELKQEDFLMATRMLLTVLHNLYLEPDMDRYKHLRTTNPVIREIVALKGVHACLLAAGFNNADDGNYHLTETTLKEDVIYFMDKLIHARKRLGVMEAWEIFPSDLEVGEAIGSGKFGKVFEGTWHGRRVAIKTIRKKHDANARSDFEREAQIMKELNHPNLLQLLGVVLLQEPCLLIMELMGASFLDLLKTCRLPDRDVLDCAMQIAAGLEYVHHKGFIHCDIACRNVLVANSGRLVVSDFGLARKIGTEECNLKGSKAKFPIRWTAPEVFRSQQLSKASDVWSYGVLFWEIVAGGDIPFSNLDNKDAKRAVREGKHPERPEKCRAEFYGLMQQCWQYSPDDRPDFGDLIQELLSLKIMLAHSHREDVVREVEVPRRRSAGWFSFPRKRSDDGSSNNGSAAKRLSIVHTTLAEPSTDDSESVVSKVLKVFTVLVAPNTATVTLKANYSDKAKKLVTQALKRCGVDFEDASFYCLAEVGRNGIHSREIPDEDHPLSWMASPFFSDMHDIYLCKRTQVPIIHEMLKYQQQMETARYQVAVAAQSAASNSPKNSPKAKKKPAKREEALAPLDDTEDSATTYSSQASTHVARDSDRQHRHPSISTRNSDTNDEGDEDDDDAIMGPWFERVVEVQSPATTAGGAKSMTLSVRRRRLREGKSCLYEGMGAGGQPGQSQADAGKLVRARGFAEALYESHQEDEDENDQVHGSSKPPSKSVPPPAATSAHAAQRQFSDVSRTSSGHAQQSSKAQLPAASSGLTTDRGLLSSQRSRTHSAVQRLAQLSQSGSGTLIGEQHSTPASAAGKAVRPRQQHATTTVTPLPAPKATSRSSLTTTADASSSYEAQLRAVALQHGYGDCEPPAPGSRGLVLTSASRASDPMDDMDRLAQIILAEEDEPEVGDQQGADTDTQSAAPSSTATLRKPVTSPASGQQQPSPGGGDRHNSQHIRQHSPAAEEDAPRGRLSPVRPPEHEYLWTEPADNSRGTSPSSCGMAADSGNSWRSTQSSPSDRSVSRTSSGRKLAQRRRSLQTHREASNASLTLDHGPVQEDAEA